VRRALTLVLLAACADPGADGPPPGGGKADGFAAERALEVLFTSPHCDVCTTSDKEAIAARAPITSRLVALLDGAERTVEIANFTFSARDLEAAVLRARGRGVSVRVAMDQGQKNGDTVATRLESAGVPVRFVSGAAGGDGQPPGLQHAKFVIVDETTLATGSNNWSSTGTTINEESTIVVGALPGDPLVAAFGCHFEAMWAGTPEAAAACSTDEVAFSPGGEAVRRLRDGLRAAQTSIDVLMHHLVFEDLLKELAKAAERGVKVRIVVNAADRDEHRGPTWDRLARAGGELRYKQTNAELFQLMHHKLAIVDGRVLLSGSGNWSGSAFFKNHENFVRWTDPRVVQAYGRAFERLWTWSLTAASLDGGVSAARQHATSTRVFFGNLHAHHAAKAEGVALDDGQALRDDGSGHKVAVDVGLTPADAARFAYEYARDEGRMDFLALSPHASDDGPLDAGDNANMSEHGFGELVRVAGEVSDESGGAFLALPAMEWSTNSTGNHVNILGSRAVARVERGRFDRLYHAFLPERVAVGDRPLVQLNHPRTFRRGEESLEGSWDQIFDVRLSEIPKAGEREKKFNDYGLDDFPPLRDALPRWIAGDVLPDRETVRQGMAAVEAAGRPYARLMEVLVGRGTEIAGEARENPSLVRDARTGAVERMTRVHSDWDHYLLHGFRLAPTAPHDNHFANWGTGHSSRTAIAAATLTEDAILDAIDARAVYASEDEDLVLRFYADGRVPMGGELGTRAASARLEVLVEDPGMAGPFEVSVHAGTIGGDAVSVVARRTVAGGAWETIEVPLSGPGTRFFYLEVTAPAADRMAWSAPIWIERL
jgi:phosphatidylserine/phosphatidylglycerophosphate/cardiolipin synthase-like enzyme